MMRTISLILGGLLLVAGRTQAQEDSAVPDTMTQEEQRITIFDALETTDDGKGHVIIHQPEAIRDMVGIRQFGENVEKTLSSEIFLKMQGYRAQVFSGNNQRVSKEEAFEKEKEIKELFPDLTTYVTYMAPFWKVRVGDFRTSEEAHLLLRQLKTAFPAYGKEMYIVREEIRIPLH